MDVPILQINSHNEIIQYMVIYDWLFTCPVCCSMAVLNFFLLLGNISLHRYTFYSFIHSFIHQLVNIWIVSTSWLLWIPIICFLCMYFLFFFFNCITIVFTQHRHIISSDITVPFLRPVVLVRPQTRSPQGWRSPLWAWIFFRALQVFVEFVV